MHIQTYNRYKFQEDNCRALNSSMGMCVTQQPGHTGVDEQEPEWLRVCPVAVPAGVGGTPPPRVPSPVLGVQLPRVWEGHGVVAGLVSVELKPSAVSIHDCLLVKTF